MTPFLDPVIAGVGRWTLVILFVASAISKIASWEEFVGIVQNYKLLPDGMVRMVGYAIPVLEITAAVCLLISATRPYGAVLSAGLLVVFSVAIGINIFRGRTHVDCGCFMNSLSQRLSGWLIVRNIVLLGFAFATIPSLSYARSLHWIDYGTMLLGSMVLLLLYLSINFLSQEPKRDYSIQQQEAGV